MRTTSRRAIYHMDITCTACGKGRANTRRHITDGVIELNPCLCNDCDQMTDAEVLKHTNLTGKLYLIAPIDE